MTHTSCNSCTQCNDQETVSNLRQLFTGIEVAQFDVHQEEDVEPAINAD